jgi:hypothetical protein
MGEAMRAGLAVLIVVVMSRPELARSQSDLEAVRTIFIHPSVTTMLQLPDEVVDTWLTDRGEIRVASKGNEVAVRPHAGTPAGVEASLEVKTGTMYRTFRLRVVAHARDASRSVLVLAAGTEHDTDEPAPETPPVAPAETMAPVMCAEAVAPAVPPVSVSANEPGPMAPPAAPEPATATDTAADTEHDTAIDIESATRAASAPGFDLSVQAVLGLGFTALDFARYAPHVGLQSHQVLSVRLAGEPRGGWWAPEVEVSAEWTAAV